MTLGKFNLKLLLSKSVIGKSLITIAALLWMIPVAGSVPTLRFKYFTKKDGLSNYFVNTIAQDSVGYIWLGSINGLVRYDGKVFNVYYSVGDDSTAIPHHNVTYLYTGRNGTLWVATNNGLCFYNSERNNFVRMKFDRRYNESENMVVGCVAEDSKGEMFASSQGIIYKLDKQTNVFIPYISISPGEISAFVIDSNDNLWIAGVNGGGLTYFNSKKLESFRFPVDYQGNTQSLPSSEIQDLVVLKGQVWLATRGSGLVSYSPETKSFTMHSAGLPNTEQVLSLYIDRKKNLWVIDYTGLKFFDIENNSFHGYYSSYSVENSIKNMPIKIFQDTQDNYWVAHTGGGLGIRTPPTGFENISHNPFSPYNLTSGNIRSIMSDREGNFWFANGRPGIDVFNWSKAKTDSYIYQKNSSGSLGEGTVNVIFRDRDQNMWVGTYSGGLQLYDYSKKTFLRYVHKKDDPFSISSNDVKSIAQDQAGNLWIVVHGTGVDRFNPRTGKFYNFNKEKNKLSNPWTNQVLCAQNGDVWVASAWGLSRLKPGQSVFESFYSHEKDPFSLTSSSINVIFEDSKGNIWAGTDNGLNRFVDSNQTFVRYDLGIKSSTVCSILEDDDGRLWIATLGGISLLDTSTGRIINFDETDDISNSEFIYRSAFKGYDGTLYFGGSEGVTSINPIKLILNNHIPPVVITRLKILNKSTDINDQESILSSDIRQCKYFEINHDDRLITFEFNAITYNNPDQCQYSYMLEGFDKGWQDNKNVTTVTYTNLDPGTYTFKVRASNNDGVWNEKGTSIQFKVLPPWYLYPVTKIIIAILFIFLLYGIIKMRMRQVKRQNRQLSMQVVEKTQELLANNQELMAQAEYLDSVNKLLEERQQKVEKQAEILGKQSNALRRSNQQLLELNSTKDKLFSIIAHDLLNPFNSILGMTDLLKATYSGMSDDERIELILNISSSSNKLFNLLQNLLLWARSQTNSVKFQQENFNLLDAINESTEYYNDQIQAKNIRFKVDCNAEIMGFGDVDMFKTIIRNLLNNAIKFTRKNGSVEIIVKTIENYIHISVTDDGIGMLEPFAQKLFSQSAHIGQIGTDGERGTGLGLIICKEFVERNKGTIKVTSEKGKGSDFTFTLPVARWQ